MLVSAKKLKERLLPFLLSSRLSVFA